jgi:hypothetical protein
MISANKVGHYFGAPEKGITVVAVEANTSWTCLSVRYYHRFVSLFAGFLGTIGIGHNDEGFPVQYRSNVVVCYLLPTYRNSQSLGKIPSTPAGMHVIKRLPRLVGHSFIPLLPTDKCK